MPSESAPLLDVYADVAVKVGLNLQPKQRLLVIGPLANGGVALEAAPLVRAVAASAYRAGAALVETLWGDEALQTIRFRDAPRDSFDQFSAWLPGALARHAEDGHALLSIYANDPDLLNGQPSPLVGAMQQATATRVRPFRELISRNATNWCVVGAASPAWADRVFPDLPAAERVSRLWKAIGRLCRLDARNPVAAWEEHLAALFARTVLLNQKRYRALRYAGPGIDLTIGLADGHIWTGGRSTTRSGIAFAPNLPTEEVFTIPDCRRVDGTVRSSKPLSLAGTLVEGFGMRFEHGRIVHVEAARGEAILKDLVATDAGAARLGEVALVPHSSPVSQTSRLFFNTLYDENAASHVAIGSAYKFTLEGGELLSDEEFERRGGNRSAVHVDFMIGSGELDIDGVFADGRSEPVMRRGEWAEPTP